jgi:uncharacterized membrane protein (UPF0127 family)
MTLMCDRTHDTMATDVEVANSRRDRRKGLLGRDGLDPGAALVLSPCAAIHTAFMRFPIDAVFLRRDGRVVRIVRNLQPWRIALSLKAHTVVEFAAGVLDRHPVEVGDRLYLAC